MASQGRSRVAGPVIGIAIVLGVGYWLTNAKLGDGGGVGLGGKQEGIVPAANSTPKSEPEKPKDPASTPAASAPTQASVSIQVDTATNTVRYVLEGQPAEPGKFQEQLKAFLEKNPSIKEIVLTSPPETPAADVLAVQQAISSFPGVTYTVKSK